MNKMMKAYIGFSVADYINQIAVRTCPCINM